MLYLAEDSTDIFVSGWILLWENDENAIWIAYRPCSLINSENELKRDCKSDWKSGPFVEFPIIMIFDQIEALTHLIHYWIELDNIASDESL